MALTKKQKQELVKKYATMLSQSETTVAVQQDKIPVPVFSRIRSDIRAAWGQLMVVKKKVLLRAAQDAWMETIGLDLLPWSVSIVVSWEDWLAPMKVLALFIKKTKKELWEYRVEFLGGRQSGKWQQKEYVTELANLPSKPELVSKLLFLLQYPIKSVAYTLSQIAEKK